ncbi:glycosyltransferase family 2 protein [Oceanispirochaeta sp. M2]|uniref:glycosyltransferase family 2 protein n=2 Tax=Oceanispirochaeta TaxID=2035349 RepID=UPI000E091BE0|nr:glycosyltransferase family A protein [Oceanispirochaeta sp. M1]MBF9018851.1 glycosyltransferase family 2 protein [Oceanispirochaeta sp. M2]NPD75339.1 glycosyltransferase family 2 protein [Oceanispirochaeta sp. M1]RDG28813.1 glycosyltransferase family 2 protein [Oceanispirochaeta sp. M1]
MDYPLISAVIPVYNRPDQCLEAVKSVLAQTYRPLELIIGDDGSEDHTLDVIRSFLSDYEGDISVKILELDHSGFPGAVRNSCVERAEGEFTAFLDSDDLWRPGKLLHQYETVHKDHPDCLISHTREEWNRRGKIISQAGMDHKREGFIFTDALKKCIIGPSTVMMRRDLYRETHGFRRDMEIAEDYEYWLRLTAVYEISFLDEPMTIKRAGHGDQLSEKYGQIEIFRIRGLKDLVDQTFFTVDLQKLAARELSRKCSVYGRGCMKRDKEEEGQEYLDMAGYYEIIATSPSSLS